MQQSYFI
jgi:hypothetical protein